MKGLIAAADIPSLCLEQGTRNKNYGWPSSPALVADRFSAVFASVCSRSGHEEKTRIIAKCTEFYIELTLLQA
jgi:hypothetical protein